MHAYHAYTWVEGVLPDTIETLGCVIVANYIMISMSSMTTSRGRHVVLLGSIVGHITPQLDGE
jgi:hypothetical protein